MHFNIRLPYYLPYLSQPMMMTLKGSKDNEVDSGPGLTVADVSNITCPEAFKRPYDVVCPC